MLSQNANSVPITKHLILQTRNKLFGNFKCTIQRKDGIGHLVCTESKSTKVFTPLSIQSSLVNTQKRLKESEKKLKKVVEILNIEEN